MQYQAEYAYIPGAENMCQTFDPNKACPVL